MDSTVQTGATCHSLAYSMLIAYKSEFREQLPIGKSTTGVAIRRRGYESCTRAWAQEDLLGGAGQMFRKGRLGSCDSSPYTHVQSVIATDGRMGF